LSVTNGHYSVKLGYGGISLTIFIYIASMGQLLSLIG